MATAEKAVYATVHLLHGGRRFARGDRLNAYVPANVLSELLARDEATHTLPKPVYATAHIQLFGAVRAHPGLRLDGEVPPELLEELLQSGQASHTKPKEAS